MHRPAGQAPPDARAGDAPLDEQTLVVRAQEGDPAAFSELAARHQVVLHRVALRLLGNCADAEDAVQEALLSTWRRIGRFRADSAFSTWAYRIVTNRCLEVLRARTPVPVDPFDGLPDDLAAVSAPPGPERAAEIDAELAALRRALYRLPDEQRVCWVLRELEGLGYAEIAELTGTGETAVRGRLHRARTTLAEVMRPWR